MSKTFSQEIYHRWRCERMNHLLVVWLLIAPTSWSCRLTKGAFPDTWDPIVIYEMHSSKLNKCVNSGKKTLELKSSSSEQEMSTTSHWHCCLILQSAVILVWKRIFTPILFCKKTLKATHLHYSAQVYHTSENNHLFLPLDGLLGTIWELIRF